MKILVIGSGGREHALAWCAARSPKVQEVLVAPGNAGTALEHKVRNIDLAVNDIEGLLKLAESEQVALTIVGPEQPLVEGIVDRFQAAGLACFGPSADAASLEGSKAYAKAFMARHGIPTAAYAEFTDHGEALAYVKQQPFPLVIKADGLAAGKGVVIAEDLAQAEAALDAMLRESAFGDAGRAVVIEEFLEGEEASFIVVASGQEFIEFPTSQDHKRIGEGDTGLNTGGMGAYSPAPVVTTKVRQQVIETVIRPVLKGMAAEGHPYTGFLYAGLMIAPSGAVKVLEFNCRLGDPETQPLLMRLNSDLILLLEAALNGQLQSCSVSWDHRPCVGVVLAAAGYPGAYQKGMLVTGLEADQDDEGMKLFHAGTQVQGGQVVTSGGRVFAACALGADLTDAQQKAYQLAAATQFDQCYYRHDIAHRALTRVQASGSEQDDCWEPSTATD